MVVAGGHASVGSAQFPLLSGSNNIRLHPGGGRGRIVGWLAAGGASRQLSFGSRLVGYRGSGLGDVGNDLFLDGRSAQFRDDFLC